MGNELWHFNYRKVYAIGICLNQIKIINVIKATYKEKKVNFNFPIKEDIKHNFDYPNSSKLYDYLNH